MSRSLTKMCQLFALLSDPETLEILTLLKSEELEKCQIVAHFGRVEPPIREKLDKLISTGYVVCSRNKYSLANKNVMELIDVASKCTCT